MLNNIEKNNPFKVPENYFQNFNNEIMNNLPEKKSRKKKVSIWMSVGRWVAAAIIIGGVSILGSNYFDSPTSNTATIETGSTNKENLASLENDYYLFLQDQATQLEVRDAIYNVGL